MGDRVERNFTVERAERVLSGPLSQDLPENIDEIEAVIGKAYLDSEIDLMQSPLGSCAPKVAALLKAKGLLPDWDILDLTLKVAQRFVLGGTSWDFGLGEKRKEDLDIYERLKDRPSVKAVVELGGLCQDAFLVIRTIAAIDEKLAKGETYNDVYQSIIYFDDLSSNHAFLNHVEERFKKTVGSQEELLSLAEIQEETYEEYKKTVKAENAAAVEYAKLKDISAKARAAILAAATSDLETQETIQTREEFLAGQAERSAYKMALLSRYTLALGKCLREGGKYKDLLAINPKDFGLPTQWCYPYDPGPLIAKEKGWASKSSQEGMILQAINLHFGMSESIYRTPLREVAKLIEAPYSVVLKASKTYEYVPADEPDEQESAFAHMLRGGTLSDDDFIEIFHMPRSMYRDTFGFTPEDVYHGRAAYPLPEMLANFKEDILLRLEKKELPTSITIAGRRVDTLSALAAFLLYETAGKEPEDVAADLGAFKESDYWDNTQYFSAFAWFLFFVSDQEERWGVRVVGTRLIRSSREEARARVLDQIKTHLVNACITDKEIAAKISVETLVPPVLVRKTTSSRKKRADGKAGA